MLPLIPFVAGIAVGVAAIRFYKNEDVHQEWEKVKKRLCASTDSARKKLRDGTVEGLSRIEQSSARLREKLDDDAQPSKVSARKSVKKTSAQRKSRKA
ncbi:MAG: hypothetical protein LBS40_03995 [Burkholderiales bacterium]|jgi:uncharacterized membrane-anchored protein YhcB (DUF1043 family)|nr:hypothetical protein [Burkholderiales bacterium]